MAEEFADQVSGRTLKTLPKVSLHDHLDGGLRPATIIELAAADGLTLPASDPRSLADWFIDKANSGSLVSYLETFEITTAVMQSEMALARVAREAVTDLAADGVVYAELRWAPEQHQLEGLSLDAAVEAVQTGIELGIEDAERTGHDIGVGQIITAMRHGARSFEVAQLALRHRNAGVVGFDIAGAEDGHPPANHRRAFDYLAEHLFPVTVHAGEAAGLDSIRSALVDGRALRIGHGVRLMEDIQLDGQDDDSAYLALGELAQWVNDRQLTLELCPSSNLQTGAIEQWGNAIADHPFDVLYRLGFAVTVNCDNRLLGGTSLSKEFALLVDAFGYGLEDLEVFTLNAAAGAFLPLQERDELVARIVEAYDEPAPTAD